MWAMWAMRASASAIASASACVRVRGSTCPRSSDVQPHATQQRDARSDRPGDLAARTARRLLRHPGGATECAAVALRREDAPETVSSADGRQRDGPARDGRAVRCVRACCDRAVGRSCTDATGVRGTGVRAGTTVGVVSNNGRGRTNAGGGDGADAGVGAMDSAAACADRRRRADWAAIGPARGPTCAAAQADVRGPLAHAHALTHSRHVRVRVHARAHVVVRRRRVGAVRLLPQRAVGHHRHRSNDCSDNGAKGRLASMGILFTKLINLFWGRESAPGVAATAPMRPALMRWPRAHFARSY